MGNCCSHKLTTKNIYEKFILDVLHEFKIRKYTFEDLDEFYSRATSKEIIEESGKYKEFTFLSENSYNRILKTMLVEDDINKKNPYYMIQSNIFPCYNDFLSEDPEFLFKSSMASFVLKNESTIIIYNHIKKLISISSSISDENETEIKYNYFFAFLRNYIENCIEGIPKKIISTLELMIKITIKDLLLNMKENDYSFELGNISISDLDSFVSNYKYYLDKKDCENFFLREYLIDKNFFDNLIKYTKIISNREKLDEICIKLEEEMKKILIDDNHNRIINNDYDLIAITKYDLNIFTEKFPWLWDIIDLRVYYLNYTSESF